MLHNELFHVYTFGSPYKQGLSLDQVMKHVSEAKEHILFLKHPEQLDEIGGLSLMYGVQINAMTWNNWLALRAFHGANYPGFSVAPRKRLPNLVLSNYGLPNLMGM